MIVDGNLSATLLKREYLSSHALTRTAATLALQHAGDLRTVQEVLGHAAPKVRARSARSVGRATSNPALAVPVKR
jgi:hypothetical protein